MTVTDEPPRDLAKPPMEQVGDEPFAPTPASATTASQQPAAAFRRAVRVVALDTREGVIGVVAVVAASGVLVSWKGMTAFVAAVIVGISIGAIYAIAATGLVVTYTTAGIFNLAHGAIGMFLAFIYWQLTVENGLPLPIALLLVLFVIAPALGVLLDFLVMRRFVGASITTTTVVTLGLLVMFTGAATTIWGSEPRVLNGLFGTRSFEFAGTVIELNKVAAVATAALLALGLGYFLKRTRTGVAMRAVVESQELTSLATVNPARLSAYAWALGSMTAGLSGILLAPLLQLDTFILTFLVINAYAAAMVGRLRSVPLTFAGGLGLGLFEAFLVAYLPPGGLLGSLRPSAPFVVLFVLLILLRPTGSELEKRIVGRQEPISPSRFAVLSAAGLAIAAVLAGVLQDDQVVTATSAMAIACILLSLVLLTGLSGQLSLAQMSFVGIGAVVAARSGLSPALGFLAAGLVAAPVGALIALPAIRLRGVFLALATLAFGFIMDRVVFVQKAFFYGGEPLRVERPIFFGVSFQGERAYLVLLALAFVLMSAVVIAVQRGSLGRALAAMNDSPTAASVGGLNLVRTKLVVFMLSAGLAGMAGSLLAAQRIQIGPSDVSLFASLTLVLAGVIAGITSVSGALLGGIVLAVIPQLFGPGAQAVVIGLGAAALATRAGGLAQVLSETRARYASTLSAIWRGKVSA